jgi:hypothetical protein
MVNASAAQTDGEKTSKAIRQKQLFHIFIKAPEPMFSNEVSATKVAYSPTNQKATPLRLSAMTCEEKNLKSSSILSILKD